MNKKRTLIMALICTAIPVATQAQENLIKAFDDFLNSKGNSEYIKTDMFVENNGNNDSTLTYYYGHRFDMPANKDKEVEKLRNAFKKDIDKAYKVMVKSAGNNSNENLRVGYGSNNEKTIDFGSYPLRNYMVMLVRDKCDSLKRYCYGLVWYTDTATNRLCGSLHKVYGKDPAKSKAKRIYGNANWQQGSMWSNDWDNGSNAEVRVYDNGIRVYDSGNKTVVRVYNDSIASDIDFLQRFGNLTVAYKNKIRDIVKEESLVIGISNKILALCRNYGYLLSKTEKETCIETLKDLPRIIGNKYINGILKEAMNTLKENKNGNETYKKSYDSTITNKVMKVAERNIKKWE